MPGTADQEDSATTFTLKNASSNFEGRSNNIFGCLDALEQKHISHEQSRTDTEEFANLNPTEVDLVDTRRGEKSGIERGREGDGGIGHRDKRPRQDAEKGRTEDRQVALFREPRGRAPGRQGRGGQRVPDHRNHPDSWTYYNLEDVQRSDMSESSNTRAALSFLDERRKLREDQQERERFDAGSAACSKGLFSFAKRSKNAADTQCSQSEHTSTSATASHISDIADTSSHSKKQDDKEANIDEGANKDDTDEKKEELDERDEDANEKETEAIFPPPSFKNRKGIKRNIRSRKDGDDD